MISRKKVLLNQVLSFVIVLTMVLGIIPPVEVSAADGGTGGLKISSPSDGATINGFETVKIKWNRYSGADHYLLVIKDETTGQKVFEEDVSYSSSSTRTYNIYSDDEVFTEDGHEYKIYVVAMDENDDELNNGAAWHAIYVNNELELETPEITSHGYLDTHCIDDTLYVEWDPVDGADDYTVYVKKLNGEPDYGSSNESGTNITYTWSDDCEIKVATSKLVADKWYKIALCATNTDQDIDSEWTEVYILMEESSYLNVSEYPDDLDAEKGSTGSFWIESNLDWDISCDVSWMTWTVNQVDDTHAEIIVKATSANTGTSDREAEFTISADGVDDEYVYVTQLAPEIELPSFSNVSISGDTTLGEKITWSGKVNGNGSLLETVSVGIYSKALDDSIYFRNTNIGQETYSLSGSVTTGGVVSGYDASGNAKTLDMSIAGEYTVTLHAATDAAINNYAATESVTILLSEPVGTGILGDVNSNGKVTDMDRFILGKYLAKTAGYSLSMINQYSADINTDGEINDIDYTILARHLADWIGYENLSIFAQESNSEVYSPIWQMKYSSNTINIIVSLESGNLDTSKNYLFVAEDEKGLHYSGIIPAGETSATFSIKGLQMPRGKKYSYYIVPEGIALAVAGKDNYYVSESIVPLYGGNMITSVKSSGNTVYSGGTISVDNAITVNWDGSFGVENFNIVAAIDGNIILEKTYDHSGPGSVVINASSLIEGNLTITGTVIPPVNSGLQSAVSTWKAVIVETGELVSIPYSSNEAEYDTYHKIVSMKNDGTSETIKTKIEHDFTRTENGLSYQDEGVGHSIWEDTYEICVCGVTHKISSVQKSSFSGHVDKNNDYRCELCGGSVQHLTSGAVSSYYFIEYNGKEYPIAIPSYDVEKGTNYDINAGGWNTVVEKYYKSADFDWASFVGNFELDDAGMVASGIGIIQQSLQNWNVEKLGIVLQEKEGDSSIRRAVILLGNNKVYTRGYVESTVVLSSEFTNNMMFYYIDLPDGVNITEGLEIADWWIRDYSGLALPTTGWDDDEDYLYDIVKVYSNQWLQETFCSYLCFDSSGNAMAVERIMEGDRFELNAYYDGTITAVIINNTFLNWFTTPAIKEDLKMQMLTPVKVDASKLLTAINGELAIKKSN